MKPTRLGVFTILGLFLVAVVLLSIYAPLPPVQGQQNVNFNVGGFVNNPDPCWNPFVAKTPVKVNISSATTTELVAAVASEKVYLCGGKLSMVGTTPTAQFEYGTKSSTACDTGATTLTGAFAPTSGSLLGFGETDGTQIVTIASNELCLVSGGTGPSIQGYVLIVQK